MLFNSIEFFVFLAVVLVVYSRLPQSPQNWFLLVASQLFYAGWDWRFLPVLWFSTGSAFVLGLWIEAAGAPRVRRHLLWLSLLATLGPLVFFKYAGFVVDSAHEALRLLGYSPSERNLHLPLPIGISFYTFQAVSYTVDIYRGVVPACRSLRDFALFKAFFPQLVAGPIERAGHLLPQVERGRVVESADVTAGTWLVLWGLFKKVVVADNLALLVDAAYRTGAAPTAGELVLATYGFAFQIYCDFSGYTDIARGVSRWMGFKLVLNFDHPYTATTPSEFWRRWHMSLSSWLRDYLYIPLGGNRRGPRRTYVNLMVTMVIGGLWHGAGWTFVAWGAYHGALLCIHRYLQPAEPRPHGMFVGAIKRVAMFHLVCLGWLLFRAESLSHVVSLVGALSNLQFGLAAQWMLPFAALVGPLLIVEAIERHSSGGEFPLAWPLAVRVACYAMIIAAITIEGAGGSRPFIYFQF